MLAFFIHNDAEYLKLTSRNPQVGEHNVVCSIVPPDRDGFVREDQEVTWNPGIREQGMVKVVQP
jgi:hypothetical protein